MMEHYYLNEKFKEGDLKENQGISKSRQLIWFM